MEVFVIMKKWVKMYYTELLYSNLMLSIQYKDHEWLSKIIEDIKLSKADIKCELFKLIRKNYYCDLNRLDPESIALLLDFMKKHNIINDNKEDIGL
jgi:5'-3' exonuclease